MIESNELTDLMKYRVFGLDGFTDISKSKEKYTKELNKWVSKQYRASKKAERTRADRMSQTITDNRIASEKSKDSEIDLVLAVEMAVSSLKKKYSKLNITIERVLLKTDINNKLIDSCPSNPEVGTNLYITTKLTKKGLPDGRKKRFIEPDGGLVFLYGDNSKFLLGVSENKTQGTNEKRMSEGKPEQALGNAIERTYKNIREVGNYLIDESINPYVVFASGEDLENKDSSIRERCTAMMNHSPFNKLYVHNITNKYGHPVRRTSFFIGITDVEERADIIYKMLDESIKYYLNKYPGEFDDK